MITKLSQGGHTAYGLMEFAVDTPADLDYLPINIPMGSTAIVISTSDVYMLNGDGKWVKL